MTPVKREEVPFHFVPVNKPPGPTSHDIVARARRWFGRRVKVGHMGTLDPFASGVLLIGIGKANRFAADVHSLDKAYKGVIRLGQETDSLDPTGKVVREMPVPNLLEVDWPQLAESFIGEIDQVPPAFSAKRVEGKRSYALARADRAVELASSRIEIHALTLSAFDSQRIEISVRCSTGTYVRALARDLAERLDTCGFLESLERTRIGPVGLDKCLAGDHLDGDDHLDHRLSIGDVLFEYPEIDLPEDALVDLLNGRTFLTTKPHPDTFVGLIRDGDTLRAAFRCRREPGCGIRSTMICYREGA